MFVKKFEAASLEEALVLVKEEFGPTALILSTQQKKGGLFQKNYVEVTAAKTQEAVEAETPKQTITRSVVYEAPRARRAPVRESSPKPRYIDIDGDSTGDRKRRGGVARMEETWLELGFRPETARELASRMAMEYEREDLKDPAFFQKAKAKLVGESVRSVFPEIFDTQKRWIVVGGPGAGKTSVAVKLALFLKRSGREVVLSSIEDRKVLGQKEMERYARLLEIPFLPAVKTHAEKRIVIFDTPAWENHSKAKLFEATEFDSVLAVVDARERLSEATHFIKHVCLETPLSAVAFSRLDLVRTRGFLFDMLRALKVPLMGASLSSSFKSQFKFFEPSEFSQFVTRSEVTQMGQFRSEGA